MQKPKIFLCFDEDEMMRRIAKAKDRLVYAAPSISETVAAAIGMQTVLSPRLKVDVILDVDPETLRLGYGEIGALQYLMRHSIPIRCAPGLKVGVLAVDHRSFIFAPTAKIIQDADAHSPNAINIDPSMTEWLLHAIIPKEMIVERAKEEFSGLYIPRETDPEQPGEPPENEEGFDEEIDEPEPSFDSENASMESNGKWTDPEIGLEEFEADELEELVEDIERRPPKQFDHEREILVYNGFLRFVDIKFTGGRLSSRTVRLPDDLVAVAKDCPEMIEVKATCKLFDEDEDALPEVKEFEKRVDDVRRCYTNSLGSDLGRVVLISDLKLFEKEIRDLTDEIDELRRHAITKIEGAFGVRKKRLKYILFPLLYRNPCQEIVDALQNSPYFKTEIVGRHLDNELARVFPEAASMIERMDLACIYKDVTWEMLNDKKFGEAIKRLFPNEEFTKLYSERNTIGERESKPKRETLETEDEWPSEIN